MPILIKMVIKINIESKDYFNYFIIYYIIFKFIINMDFYNIIKFII